MVLRSSPWLGWPLWNIYVTNDHGYVSLVLNTSRSFPHSRLITGFVTRLTRWVPLVEQELPTFPEHLSSPPIFSGVRVTRSLVLYVCFVDRWCPFVLFSFGHCVFCSSIYGFWLSLWYLQTLLVNNMNALFHFCICRNAWTLPHYKKNGLWEFNTTIFLLFSDDQFYWWRKQDYP